MEIPASVKIKNELVHGTLGQEWNDNFPALLADITERWSLSLEPLFTNLSYNVVIPARTQQDGQVVLKLGVPCPELASEIAALQLFAGLGAVQLLRHDAGAGALLLERAMPGAHLQSLEDDDRATRIAASLMRQLWQAKTCSSPQFRSLRDWFRALDRPLLTDKDNFPSDLVRKAQMLLRDLLATGATEVVMHGDLHHENILLSERGWLAIDPKGVCGDPAYDVGSFMINQLPAASSANELIAIFNRRLPIFSEELEIDKRRLARWAFCHAVVSAVWSLEDSEDWTRTVQLAECLEQLIDEH